MSKIYYRFIESFKYFTALFQIENNHLKYLRAIIVYKIKRKVSFPETIINLHNTKFFCRKNSMDIAHLSNFYEGSTTKLLLKLKPRTFIDVGAHIGRYSIILANMGSNVIALEPSNENFQQLNKNITLNQVGNNIKALNIGCSDINEKRNLFFYPSQEGLSSFIESNQANKKESHELRKLDDICKKIKNIDAIKIDVEGFELKVLKGAKNLIKSNSPILIIEITNSKQEWEIKELLYKQNYTCIKVLDSRNFIFIKSTNN